MKKGIKQEIWEMNMESDLEDENEEFEKEMR